MCIRDRSGPLDASDIDAIRYQMPRLEVLDMKEVELIESDKTYGAEDHREHYKLKKGVITPKMLQCFSLLVTLVLPKDITEIEDYGIYGNKNLVSIEIPGYAYNLATHNIAGLMESLDNHKVTDPKEKQTILRLSDYGRKGTQVWKLLSNTAWSKIGAPGKYIIAALASGRK